MSLSTAIINVLLFWSPRWKGLKDYLAISRKQKAVVF